MTWPRTTDPKYRSKEHRDYRASLVRQLQRDGFLICTAPVCQFDSRVITNANGNDDDGLHAGHNDDGMTYRGPEHGLCNVRDGQARSLLQHNSPARSRWSI